MALAGILHLRTRHTLPTHVHRRTKQLFGKVGIGIAIVSPDDRFLFVNEHLAGALDYAASDLVGTKLWTLTQPVEQTDCAEALEKARKPDAASARFDARLVGKSGRSVWFEITATAVLGAAKEERTLLLVAVDLTTRRESERGQSVQHLVSRTLAVAESFNDAIERILNDVGTRLQWEFGAYWERDAATERLLPLVTWRSLTHEATGFEEFTRTVSLAKGAGIPGKCWALQEPVWVSDALAIEGLPRFRAANAEGLHAVFAFPVRSASAFYGVIEFFSHDILPPDSALLNAAEGVGYQVGQFLERELAQRAVYESEVRKASILDSALDCVITIDAGGVITEFNPAAELTFGYAKSEVIGREMSDLIVPPSLREAHRAGMKRFLATGEAHVLGRRIEITGMRADGSEFPV